MFNDRHYVPAIKWKQGEREGLKELRDEQKIRLTPLVDIPTIPWNFVEERSSRTIDRHLADVPTQMLDVWGNERPLFVDMGLLAPEDRMANGRHPVDDLFERLAFEGVIAIPVIGTDRDNDYFNAVVTVNGRDQNGICIRITGDDIADADGFAAISDMISRLDLTHDRLDLILDMGSIDSGQVNLLATLLTVSIPQIPNLTGFRTFTLLTGAFPLNLSGIAPGVALIPRSDWALWLTLRAARLPRYPSYADYTASNPNQEEIDPRLIQISASIRYASDMDWVICRGRSLKSPRFGGYGQYNQLSIVLTSHPLFTGHSFSWASDYIQQCAAGGGPGNTMIWRKVATNRHMARVGHQIANLP